MHWNYTNPYIFLIQPCKDIPPHPKNSVTKTSFSVNRGHCVITSEPLMGRSQDTPSPVTGTNTVQGIGNIRFCFLPKPISHE
ncbi:hypothetical protein ACTXT7_010037 [Hymenolepis weldensis]